MGVAVVGSVPVMLVILFVPIPYISAIMIAGLGIVIGESISLATNRKRGVRLKIIAGSCVALSFLLIGFQVTLMAGVPNLNLFELLGAGAGIYLATTRL